MGFRNCRGECKNWGINRNLLNSFLLCLCIIAISTPDLLSHAAAPGASPTSVAPKGVKKTAAPSQYWIDSIGGDRNAVTAKKFTLAEDSPTVRIGGWAVDPEAKKAAGGVWVEIDDKDYPADYGVQRTDVAQHLHADAFAPSGFYCDVPISALQPGQHSLSLKILANDQSYYYQSGKIVLDVSKESAPASPTESITANMKKSSSPPKYWIDSIGGKTFTEGKVVTLSGNNPVVMIAGWAVDADAKLAAGGVLVEIDGKAYPAEYGTKRSDVADVLHTEAFALSGFQCEVPVSALAPGQHTLALTILSNNKQYYYQVKEKAITVEQK